MNNISVIDSDAERRADVCRVLLEGERHAEPFDSVGEFLAYSRSDGVALMHDRDGAVIKLCETTRESAQPVPVIGYANDPALEQAVAAMQAGAASYLAWPFTLEAFADELDRIEPAIHREQERVRRFAQARSLLKGLTPREREVLVSLMTHGTNKAIAKELDISPRTVEKYRATILTRLGVDNSAQAIRVAVEGGAFDEAQETAQPAAGGDSGLN